MTIVMSWIPLTYVLWFYDPANHLPEYIIKYPDKKTLQHPVNIRETTIIVI